MKISRAQYEKLNEILNYYYEYALKNMEEDTEGRLKENYPLGVYVGLAYGLKNVGISLERDTTGKIEINPACVEPAGANFEEDLGSTE